MQILFLLGMYIYLTLGLLFAIVTRCEPGGETVIVVLLWPVFTFLTLGVLFFYTCFRIGVLVTSRVNRRKRYLERRRKQN